MNNKPVAWMVTVENDTEFFIDEKWSKKHAILHKVDAIPVYTHQYERPHNTVLVPCDKLAEMQAELAILRKAQKK